jgi:hypothetical protein
MRRDGPERCEEKKTSRGRASFDTGNSFGSDRGAVLKFPQQRRVETSL